MLIQFTVENFGSFKNPGSLSFVESRISEFKESLLHSPSDATGILPVMMLYGPNGGGKSTILRALTFLGLSAVSSLEENPHFSGDKESKKKPSAFEIIFRIKDMEYNYQLKVSHKKVLEETLFYRNLSQSAYDVVFDRDSEGIYLDGPVKQVDVAALEDNMTMLGFLHTQHISTELDSAIGWLQNLHMKSCQQVTDEQLLDVLKVSEKKEQLLTYMNQLGYSLKDITVVKGIPYLIYANGMKLSFSQEASGVSMILMMLSWYLSKADDGGIFIADDISGSLHPALLAQFIRLFTTQKATGTAQLIATSNDMPTMHNSFLRRDEIWLCSKSLDEGSSLYTLAEYIKENGEKVRKDEVYYKQYLEGRYDSVPDIQNLS